MKEKKLLKKFYIWICFVLGIFFIYPSGVGVEKVRAVTVLSTSNVYNINGQNLRATDIPWQGAGQCWEYANKMYNRIWGHRFDSTFVGSSVAYNMLRNLNDEQRRVTAENTRKFISQAPLGAVIRTTDAPSWSSAFENDGTAYNGRYGHNMIIVQKDANGFTCFENLRGGLYTLYYTWEDFASASGNWDYYYYFKYIKWPNAPAYSEVPASMNPDDYPFPTRDLYYTNPTFKGDDVKWVQAVLNYLGYSVAIDGSYGPDCADKIASFQRDNGLGQDGKCGPATREKLKAVYEAKKNPPPSHETNPPVVSNVKIYDVDSTGYTISCKVTDESGVGTVRFPTWTEKNGQDDLDMKWWDGDSKCIGTKNGDIWTFRVKDSEHNYERGAYTTHIYAYDMHGVHNEPVEVNGTISNTYKPSATVTWNNRQYELYDDILGWSEARKKCEDLGGTLAVITSKEEQDAVNKLLKNADRYWYSIGGVKAGNEFIWLTGEKMNYTYWGKGEPNNNGGDEYHMSVYKSGTWNDSSDWVSKGFILEKELPKKPAEPEDNQGDSSNQPQNPSNPSGGQSGNSGQGGTTSDPDKNGDGNQTPTPGTGNSDTNVTEGTGQQSNSDTTKPSNGSDMTNSSTDKNTGTSRNRTVKSTTKSVTVAWKPDKNAISGYRIYVKSGRKYVKVGTTKAGKTTFTIKKIKGKSLKPGTSYTVRIVSLKKISGKLKEVKRITLKTATKPSTPSIYYGKKKSSAKAVVKWGRVSGASGYEIQMSTRSKKGFKKIATVKASKSSVTKTRLKKGKTYYFRIRAYKNVTGGKVYSSWSRVKKVK